MTGRVDSAEGKHVVIIAGGDTGATAWNRRTGRRDVRHRAAPQPEPPEYRDESQSPWPTWPLVLRNRAVTRARARRSAPI